MKAAVAGWAQTWSPLSDTRMDGHPQRGIKRSTKMLVVSFSCKFRGGDSEHVRPAAERSVKRRI